MDNIKIDIDEILSRKLAHSADSALLNYFAYFDDSVDDYLEHYGVIGMRWGHRKQRINARRRARIRKLLKSGQLSSKKYKRLSEKNKRLMSVYIQRNKQLAAAEAQRQHKKALKIEKKRAKKDAKLQAKEEANADKKQNKLTRKQYELARNKRLKEMTTEELEDAIDHIKKVNEYKSLTATRGERFRKTIADNVKRYGRQLAEGYIKGLIDKKVKEYTEGQKKETSLADLKKKSASTMSSKEIESALSRAKLEQQWEDYRSGSRFATSKEGKMYVEPRKDKPDKKKPIDLQATAAKKVTSLSNDTISEALNRAKLETEWSTYVASMNKANSNSSEGSEATEKRSRFRFGRSK